MRVAVLGSGSAGNSVIVESGGRRLLIDAGFSCRQIEQRLASLGEEAADIEALLLTHEHQDHCRGADVFLRRYGIPVHATAGTFKGAGRRRGGLRSGGTPGDGDDPPVVDARTIRSGEPFRSAGFRVEAFGIPHDAREPVGFVVEDAQGRRLGLAADLGSRTQLAWGRLRDLDCLIIEANHDLQMLRTGPYPWHLKQRVASRHGHLSNREAAVGLEELVSDRLETVVLYHLSRTNNLPALAARSVGEKLADIGCAAEIVLARQHEPTAWIELTGAGPRPGGPRERLDAVGSEPLQLEIW